MRMKRLFRKQICNYVKGRTKIYKIFMLQSIRVLSRKLVIPRSVLFKKSNCIYQKKTLTIHKVWIYFGWFVLCYTFYNKSYTQSYQNIVLNAFICSYLLQISLVRRPLTGIGLKPTILIFFILLNLIAFLCCVIMWDVDHWNNTMQWVVR